MKRPQPPMIRGVIEYFVYALVLKIHIFKPTSGSQIRP